MQGCFTALLPAGAKKVGGGLGETVPAKHAVAVLEVHLATIAKVSDVTSRILNFFC